MSTARNDNATGQGGEALILTASDKENSITPGHSTGEQLSFLPPPYPRVLVTRKSDSGRHGGEA